MPKVERRGPIDHSLPPSTPVTFSRVNYVKKHSDFVFMCINILGHSVLRPIYNIGKVCSVPYGPRTWLIRSIYW